jgi:hypothetical protein
MADPVPAAASSADSSEQQVGAPPPPLGEGARAAAAVLSAQLRDARTRGQRSLFIHVLLMFLVSIVVFVVGTYFFVVPRVIRQNLDTRLLEQKAARLDKRLAVLERAEPLTPASAAPGADLIPPAPAATPPVAKVPAAPVAADPAPAK